jgi:hypothetical protein
MYRLCGRDDCAVRGAPGVTASVASQDRMSRSPAVTVPAIIILELEADPGPGLFLMHRHTKAMKLQASSSLEDAAPTLTRIVPWLSEHWRHKSLIMPVIMASHGTSCWTRTIFRSSGKFKFGDECGCHRDLFSGRFSPTTMTH